MPSQDDLSFVARALGMLRAAERQFTGSQLELEALKRAIVDVEALHWRLLVLAGTKRQHPPDQST
jgi:hypothetical protein